MSYQDFLSKVKALVESHNENAGVDVQIDWDEFVKKLHAAGGTNEAALALCKYEDLESFGLPRLIARQAASIFREEKPAEKKPRLITETRARHLTAREAFEHYDPRDADTPVGERLKDLSKGLRCVVFNNDGSVNPESSARLVEEIRDGYPERDQYELDGVPVHIYRVGERPFDYKDENPIYKGRMLRPDGTCDQLNRSWSGVSRKARQLVYIAVNMTGEISIKGINDAQDVLDMCLDGGEQKLLRRFPKTALKYRELEEADSLPSLRVSVSNSDKLNDPFHGGHKRF